MDVATLPELDILAPGGGRYRLHEFGRQAVPLGKGGAGSVYRHPLLPGQAIKIYHDQRRAEAHQEKVRAMLQTPPRAVRTPGDIVQLAWPDGEAVLQGRFIGFVMPLIDFNQAWKLQQAVDPPKRRRHRLPERLEFRLYAARNLVAVLHSLHEAGHYVIDLKPQNVLVYRDQLADAAAHVILVDCDGFQIRGPDGRRHDADLATPEFLHPEVARQHQGDPSFDKRKINDNAAKQDNFALAVILFQLLNDGLHPMAGRPSSSKVPSDLASRLQKCGLYYPYRSGGNGVLRPDEDSLHRWFDPALRALFDRAFAGQGEPPPQREWLSVLDRLVHPDQRCLADPDHWKLGSQCGLCERAAVRQTAAPARAPASMRPPAVHAAVNAAPPAGAAFASPRASAPMQGSPQPTLSRRMGRRGGRGRRLLFGVLLLAAMLGIGFVRAPRLLWQVRHRLESLAAASPASPAPAEVKRLQAELAALGYYHGPADGVAGALTIQAATAFADAHGLALSAPLGEAQLRQVLELAGAKAAPPAIMPLAVPLTAWADRAVAVRKAPAGSAAIIGTIRPGQAVTVLGRAAGSPWLMIAASEGRGFVPAAAFAAAVPAAPAAAAAAKAAPAALAGVPEVIDTSHLRVDGRSVTLQGIEGLGGRPAQELAAFIRNRGGRVSCRFLQQGYACRTAGGIDIALAALLNGAAMAAADASPAQRQAQDQARAAHRGMWK